MLLPEIGQTGHRQWFRKPIADHGQGCTPRVLPEHRRRGGRVRSPPRPPRPPHRPPDSGRSAPMSRTMSPTRSLGKHGFQEVDRQVEQVRTLRPDEPAAPPYEGVEFWTVAQGPELLQRSFALAQQGYADMVLKTGPAVVPIDEWLREEATLPAGTFVALEHGIIVGYAGLLAWTDDLYAGRKRADRRRPSLARPRPGDRPEAAPARVGSGQRHPGGRGLDPGGQRGDAAGQRQPRLHATLHQPDDATRSPSQGSW